MNRLLSLVLVCLVLVPFPVTTRASAQSPEQRATDYHQNAYRAAPRDAFPVLDDPEMTPASEAGDTLRDSQWVIGVEVNGEARAYPVNVMGVHELVNDRVGGHPVAVCW